MKTNEETFKPTITKPMSDQSKNFEKNFNKTMKQTAPSIKLTETDELLTEKEQSLKKKIFSLPKMEALVFSDPKLTAVYNDMAEDGEEKYGYHYNETIQNIIFNDYVLNSPKYLQKYKMAIPKKKKRRDKSGINQLKRAGEKIMKQVNIDNTKPSIQENDDELTKVVFLVHEKEFQNDFPDLFAYFPEENYDETGRLKTGYSHVGQHSAVDPRYAEESREATPEEYAGLKSELESIGYNLEVLNGANNAVDETTSAGSAGGAAGYVGYAGPKAWAGNSKPAMRKPIWKGGTVIGESNYITDPSGFEKYVQSLNEQSDDEFIKNHSDAFSVDPMSNVDKKIIKKDIQTGVLDKPNLNTVEEGISPDMYSTKEDLKELIQNVKQRTGKGLTKDHIPMLAGEALYTIAIQMANKMLPMHWDDLPDTNSMWDYIDENGNMSYERLLGAVKEAVNDRLSEEGYGLDDLYEGKTDLEEKSKSKSQQRFMGMVHALQKGELKASEVGEKVKKAAKTMKPKDVKDFASTKHTTKGGKKLPEKVEETDQSIIADNPATIANKPQPTGSMGTGNVPTGTQQTGGISEDFKLLEELNNELNAYSIHHNKLLKMAEDRKPSALVLRDRVGSENEKNFKKDLQHSGTKEIINVEKELMWKDQQTDVGNDPQKLGQDIEKKELSVTKGKSFDNVGDSANDKGNEIPKRNLTGDEQDEVNMYRLGQQDIVYDNEPGKRFEDRMKADMGDDLYKQRQEKMKFRAKAPMYNKDTQPTEKGIDKNQFDKNESGWNEREGLSESMITGRYRDALNKSRIIDFTLNEVKTLTTPSETARQTGLFELDFTGLGNSYLGKTQDNKVSVNETVVTAINSNKFYTDGKVVYAIKNVKKSLNEEVDVNKKPIVNEQVDKMKHLLGYKPNDFVDTKNIKKNRGF